MKINFDPNLLAELIDQSHNPPGSDPVLGAFYTAWVSILENSKALSTIINKVQSRRKDVTYKHLVNLLFRAYQSVKFQQGDLSYRTFIRSDDWYKELQKLAKNKDNKDNFKKLLLGKSTSTTIYQRYAGPYAITAFFWDGKAVTVSDLGCGGNYGLRGIELSIPFKQIVDLTPKRLLSKLLKKKINLKKGLAVDKEDPNNQQVKNWRIACSFYPSELDNLPKVWKFEEKISQSSKVEFLKAELLTTKRLPKRTYDVVILSSILYQLNFTDQFLLIEKSKNLLKSGGLIVVQDFAAKNLANPYHLDLNESWFGKDFSYRTFIAGSRTRWRFLEAFQWNNGRCLMAQKGEDFNKIFTSSHARVSKAAFAHSTS